MPADAQRVINRSLDRLVEFATWMASDIDDIDVHPVPERDQTYLAVVAVADDDLAFAVTVCGDELLVSDATDVTQVSEAQLRGASGRPQVVTTLLQSALPVFDTLVQEWEARQNEPAPLPNSLSTYSSLRFRDMDVEAYAYPSLPHARSGREMTPLSPALQAPLDELAELLRMNVDDVILRVAVLGVEELRRAQVSGTSLPWLDDPQAGAPQVMVPADPALRGALARATDMVPGESGRKAKAKSLPSAFANAIALEGRDAAPEQPHTIADRPTARAELVLDIVEDSHADPTPAVPAPPAVAPPAVAPPPPSPPTAAAEASALHFLRRRGPAGKPPTPAAPPVPSDNIPVPPLPAAPKSAVLPGNAGAERVRAELVEAPPTIRPLSEIRQALRDVAERFVTATDPEGRVIAEARAKAVKEELERQRAAALKRDELDEAGALGETLRLVGAQIDMLERRRHLLDRLQTGIDRVQDRSDEYDQLARRAQPQELPGQAAAELDL